MFHAEYSELLHKLYEWSIVGPDDVDDTRYTISKKLSEVWRQLVQCAFVAWANQYLTDGIIYCRIS